MITTVLTVNPLPAPISGASSICVGGYDTLTGGVGGTWSTTGTVVTMMSPGILYGISAGMATITYTATTGCAATFTLSVNATVSPITGPNTVCTGFTITLSDGTGGGVWSSSVSSVATVGGGVVTGGTAGTTMITYMLASGCLSSMEVTVNGVPSSISGPSSICVGVPTGMSDAVIGGTWSSPSSDITLGITSGVVTGVTAGTATISYTASTGCSTSTVITINPAPGMISGPTGVCMGSTITLTDATGSGTWISSAPSVAPVNPTTGVVNGLTAGTTTIYYQLATGCTTSMIETVSATPSLTLTATPASCGGTSMLIASTSGGTTNSWAPSAGLSCTVCDTSIANVAATTTYTVTATIAGCSATDTVTVNGNRISGYISLTATATDTLKVWLIQFNAVDSSLIALDSVLSCMDSGTPYYEFDSKPAGNYMVKAKLLSSIVGTSGYIPTYGLSTPVWDSAATFTHASATDTQHINMLYGTVPPGPGFIGGLIASGAGKGTSGGAPVAGMLVYLKNSSNTIVTYTYTDGTGAYSFSGIANGSYTIYPVDYHYHTIPSTVTLNTSSETINGISFYQHTTLGTITPITTTVIGCDPGACISKISTYPNPVENELNIRWENEQTGIANILITDMTGREVYSSQLDMNTKSGSTQINTAALKDGVYFISIRSGSFSYTNKIVVGRKS